MLEMLMVLLHLQLFIVSDITLPCGENANACIYLSSNKIYLQEDYTDYTLYHEIGHALFAGNQYTKEALNTNSEEVVANKFADYMLGEENEYFESKINILKRFND